MIKSNKNKIRNPLTVMLTLSCLVLVGCITPKPAPSWPNGNERPINKTPTTEKANEVKK